MLFQLEGVTKTYGPVTALRQPVRRRPGRGRRPARAERVRQDDPDPHPARADPDRHAAPARSSAWTSARRQLDIRRQVGFAPEDECLFPGVVGVEFVAYAGELVGMRPKDAMQRAHEVLDYVGLGEARYRQVESYSTGMKQRLKLASAIVHDPKLLILDEPTNGMDPAGREEVLELARDLAHNKGMSLLFSSHLLPDVEAVCDHVVVLGGGRLLAEGKIQELKQVHDRLLRGAAQGRRRPRSPAG